MTEPKLKAQFKTVATYYCGEAMGNAEKAVVMAGYSPKYARGNAYKIVAREDVQAYIKWLNSQAESSVVRRVATVEQIQAFWTDVMESGETEVKDRLRASELLAKSKGAFNNDF